MLALQAGNMRGVLTSGVLAALAIFFLMMSGNLFLLLRNAIDKRR
jgi:hypothetical protein